MPVVNSLQMRFKCDKTDVIIYTTTTWSLYDNMIERWCVSISDMAMASSRGEE